MIWLKWLGRQRIYIELILYIIKNIYRIVTTYYSREFFTFRQCNQGKNHVYHLKGCKKKVSAGSYIDYLVDTERLGISQGIYSKYYICRYIIYINIYLYTIEIQQKLLPNFGCTSVKCSFEALINLWIIYSYMKL